MKATAGPSTTLRFAQDDSIIFGVNLLCAASGAKG
jgi:hypothetical protein